MSSTADPVAPPGPGDVHRSPPAEGRAQRTASSTAVTRSASSDTSGASRGTDDDVRATPPAARTSRRAPGREPPACTARPDGSEHRPRPARPAGRRARAGTRSAAGGRSRTVDARRPGRPARWVTAGPGARSAWPWPEGPRSTGSRQAVASWCRDGPPHDRTMTPIQNRPGRTASSTPSAGPGLRKSVVGRAPVPTGGGRRQASVASSSGATPLSWPTMRWYV